MTYAFNLEDIQVIGRFEFQALQSLCRLVDNIISNSLSRFYASEYVSMGMTQPLLLQSQVGAVVSQFTSTTTKDFLSSFRTVRDTIQANSLLASVQSNAYLHLTPDSQFVSSMWKWYDNCSCRSGSTCVSQSNIYYVSNSEVVYALSGMFVGCYPMEALLQSNLECFYNETCFDELKSYLNSNAPLSASIMNSSALIQFSSKSTIDDIVDEMMVEKWSWTLTYDDYFRECRPIECSYRAPTRNDAIYIVTTVIGVTGGLVVVLSGLLSLVVHPTRYLLKRTRKISPNVTSEQDQHHSHADNNQLEDL